MPGIVPLITLQYFQFCNQYSYHQTHLQSFLVIIYFCFKKLHDFLFGIACSLFHRMWNMTIHSKYFLLMVCFLTFLFFKFIFVNWKWTRCGRFRLRFWFYFRVGGGFLFCFRSGFLFRFWSRCRRSCA